jgi:hypothetical protein
MTPYFTTLHITAALQIISNPRSSTLKLIAQFEIKWLCNAAFLPNYKKNKKKLTNLDYTPTQICIPLHKKNT